MRRSTLFTYIALLFILLFDLWVENSEEAQGFYGHLVKPILDEPKFSVIWTVLIIVALIIVFRERLVRLDQEKDELKKVLDSEMAILIMANKELNQYRLQDNLIMIMDRFVRRHSFVSAVQWYSYNENNHQGHTNFKFNYQYGSVVEEVNLNAIQQIYYHCDSALLRDFRKAKDIYTRNKNPEKLLDVIIDVYHKIIVKEESVLTQENAVLSSFVTLGLELLERDYDLVFDDFLDYDKEKFERLLNNNRTGILRAALMENEFYTFTHTRENEKLNRIYIARLVKVREEDKIFTIILDSSILDENNYHEKLLNIAKDFENLLIELEAMYNNR